MEMPKPTDDDRTYFEPVMTKRPGVTTKSMFGDLGAFVNKKKT